MARRSRSSSESEESRSSKGFRSSGSEASSWSSNDSDESGESPTARRKPGASVEAEKRWAAYRQAHMVLPLGKDTQLRRSRRAVAVEMRFDHISGLQALPNRLKPNHKSLRYSLYVSLYDTLSGRFFGNTWKSDPVKPSGKKSLQLKCAAFMNTTVLDPACLVVVEVACSQYDKRNNLVATFGCGWTMLPVFAALSDIPEHKSKRRDLVKADLYSGSPRGLLFLKDKEELVKIKNASLYYTTQKPSSKGFMRALPLVRENEIVGVGMDQVYGLKAPMSLTTVQLHKKVKLYLNKAVVLLPTNWEEKAKRYFADTYSWSDRVSGSFALRLAPHNGRREISGQGWTNVQLRAHPYDKSADYDQILKFTAPVKIGSVLSDPNVVMAFELDYTVKKHSVVAGCGVWFPFSEQSHISLTNSRPSKRSRTKLPLELQLSTNIHKPFSSGTAFNCSEDLPLLGLSISKKKGKEENQEEDSASEASKSTENASDNSEERDSESEGSASDHTNSISSLSNDGDFTSNGPLHQSSYQRRFTKKSSKRRSITEGSGSRYDMKVPLKEKNVGLKSSLLAASLTLPMHSGTKPPERHDPASSAGVVGGDENEVPRTGSALSRVARTTLRENGFVGTEGQPVRAVPPCSVLHKNIGCELRDKLKINEFTFQFAAYRLAEANINAPKPKAVFFSYQFYDFLPTRTERMKLKQHGPVFILTRPSGGPSLGLKYTVDLGKASRERAEDFFKYLISKPLGISVWDADSLLMIGSCMVELQELLRAGNKDASLAMEYDILAARPDEGGVDLSTNKGQVAGRLQLILNNHGYRSVEKGEAENVKENGQASWRHQSLYNNDQQSLYRVHAKPLNQTDANLRSLLKSSKKSKYLAKPSVSHSEWAFTPSELHALTYALDRKSEGKIKVPDLLQLVGYGHEKKMQVYDIRILEEHVTSELYMQFLNFDDGFDATVTRAEFNRIMTECCGRVFRSRMGERFVQGQDRVNYEKFLLCVLKDKTSDLESKLSRVLMKAEKVKKLKLSDVFQHHFDENQDGLIQHAELKHGLETLGFTASEEELNTILTRYGDGKTLRFADFACLAKAPQGMVPRLRKVLVEARSRGLNVEQIFGHFDQDKNGEITALECQQALNEIGLVATEEDVTDVFAQLGKSSSETIKIADFLKFFKIESDSTTQVLQDIRAKAEEIKAKAVELQDIQGMLGFDDLIMVLHDLKIEVSTGDVHAAVSHLLTEQKKLSWKALLDGQPDEEAVEVIDRIVREFSKAVAAARSDGEELSDIFSTEADNKVTAQAMFKALDLLNVEVPSNSKEKLLKRLGFSNAEDAVDQGVLLSELGYSSTESDLEDFLLENLHALRKRLKRLDKKGKGSLSVRRVLQAFRELGFNAGSTSNELCIEDELEELNLVNKEGKVVYERLVDFFSLKRKLCSACQKATRSGIDVKTFLTRRDRQGSGCVDSSQLLPIFSDFGMSLSESHQEADTDTPNKQLAIVNELRQDRYIQPLRLKDSGAQDLRDRESQLDLVRRYREGQKQGIISNLLQSSLCTTKEIYPSFGTACFFEIPFENPYSREECFHLKWKDTELRVLTNAEEWQIHRSRLSKEQLRSLPQVEHEMITPETLSLTLAANEKVSLPFVFQSFCCGFVEHDTKEHTSKAKAISPRVIEVAIVSGTHMHTVRMVKVNVKPRQFNVESEIRLACPKDEVLKTSVKLRNVEQKELFAFSFEENVVLTWHKQEELSIKFRHQATSSEFYVLVYNDAFHADLRSILHFFVQEMERVDVHATAGQRSTKELLLRGDKFSRRVRCYSDSPGEVSFFPAKTFQLIPGAFNKIELSVCPQVQHSWNSPRKIKVHLVDVDSQELVYAWLVFMTVRRPQVSKTFNVELPLHQSCNKKIAYTNPWDTAHTFIIRSSDPLNVRVKQPQLNIAPKTKSFIRLWFKAEHEAVERQVELYVNDKNDQNEECICLNLTYV